MRPAVSGPAARAGAPPAAGLRAAAVKVGACRMRRGHVRAPPRGRSLFVFFKLGSSLERALFGHLRFRFLKKR